MKPTQRILAVLALLSALLTFGTLSFHWIEGWTVFEGFYMTLMTLTTVGYGEIHPLSFQGRVVAAVLMMGGVLAVFISIGLMVDTLLKMELADHFGRRRRQRMVESLSGHYIVCGAGRVGRSVIRELRRGGVPVLLVDRDERRAEWGNQENIPTLIADATQDETLRRARVTEAKGLVAAISTDAENVYVTLSARGLNPNLIISARATDEQAEEKLRRAGATTVLTPYRFIGHRLAQSMLRPHVLSFLDVASAFSGTGDLEIETEQLHVSKTSLICGKTLEESRIRQLYGVIVLALKKGPGNMMFNPAGNARVDDGDVLIAMGERDQLKRAADELKVQVTLS